MPGELQPAGGEDLHEVADLQARGRRVEADIEGDRARIQVFTQLVQIGGVLQQASPEQVVDYLGHAVIVAHRLRPGTPGYAEPDALGDSAPAPL